MDRVDAASVAVQCVAVHDMVDAPLPVHSTALQALFYLLPNLAVGGSFTDAATPELRRRHGAAK